MKAVRAAHVSKKNWKQELYNFLRQYRNTPHPSTGISPFTLMFNRETRIKLPQIPSFAHRPLYEVARQQDEHAKLKMKINNTNLGQNIKSGDTVLIRNETGNKLTPAYNSKTQVVLNAKGTMILAAPCSNPLEKCVTRNASFFKKIRRQDDIQPQFSEVAEEEEMSTTRTPESRCTTTRPTEDSKESVPNGTVNSNATRERPYTTRSGRAVRQPSAFKDCVKMTFIVCLKFYVGF